MAGAQIARTVELAAHDVRLETFPLLARFRRGGPARVIDLAEMDEGLARAFCRTTLERLKNVFDNYQSDFTPYRDPLLVEFACNGLRQIVRLDEAGGAAAADYIAWLRNRLEVLLAREIAEHAARPAMASTAAQNGSIKPSAPTPFQALEEKWQTSLIEAVMLLTAKDSSRMRSFKGLAAVLVACGFQGQGCVPAVRTRAHRLKDRGWLIWTDRRAMDIAPTGQGLAQLKYLLDGGIPEVARAILFACALDQLPELRVNAERDGWTSGKSGKGS